MLLAKSIEFFENLSQYEYSLNYYDLHNDYGCKSVSLENNVLFINFKHEKNEDCLNLKFTGVEVKQFVFFNVSNMENLTIDNIYRGKVVIDGDLKEFLGEKGYFFLEFDEGQRLEFWAESVGVEKSNKKDKTT